jgi:hypothetical protein
MRKIFVGTVIGAVGILGLGTSALAGEVTGSGHGGPNGDGVTGMVANGNSPCGFSGLEDDPLEPGTVQNWGQVKDFLGGGGANGPIVTPFGEDGCNARDFGHK